MKFTSLENLQYFLNKLSYVSKESGILNSIITSYLNDFKRDVVQIVSTLPFRLFRLFQILVKSVFYIWFLKVITDLLNIIIITMNIFK